MWAELDRVELVQGAAGPDPEFLFVWTKNPGYGTSSPNGTVSVPIGDVTGRALLMEVRT